MKFTVTGVSDGMFSGEERILLSIIVSIYFVFLILLALYMNKKTKTYEDYNVAGRSVSFFPMLLTFIGTGVGGSTLLGYMENGYSLGTGSSGYILPCLHA